MGSDRSFPVCLHLSELRALEEIGCVSHVEMCLNKLMTRWKEKLKVLAILLFI